MMQTRTILENFVDSLYRLRDIGKGIEAILLDGTLVARGFQFFVEYDEKIYFAVNDKDMNVELARLMQYPHTFEVCDDAIMGVPVLRDYWKMLQIMSGVFIWP